MCACATPPDNERADFVSGEPVVAVVLALYPLGEPWFRDSFSELLRGCCPQETVVAHNVFAAQAEAVLGSRFPGNLHARGARGDY